MLWEARSGGRCEESKGESSHIHSFSGFEPIAFDDSVDAEWIVARKDWQEAKKKQKARGMSSDGAPVDNGNTHQELPPQYSPEMDEMRCILYAHGGMSVTDEPALYSRSHFAQVATTLAVSTRRGGHGTYASMTCNVSSPRRYSIQRLARKINGRVFGEPLSLSVLHRGY